MSAAAVLAVPDAIKNRGQRTLRDQADALMGNSLLASAGPVIGALMLWFDRSHTNVVFGDQRSQTLQVLDRSHGRENGTRTLQITPDVLLDFRALPYPDGRFKLVVFDPPHLLRAGSKSWLAAKYGKLGADWQTDIAQGFAECFRVLEPDGILIFKWNETQIKLRQILALTEVKPLFGHTSGKAANTHWVTFMKRGHAKAAGGNINSYPEIPNDSHEEHF